MKASTAWLLIGATIAGACQGPGHPRPLVPPPLGATTDTVRVSETLLPDTGLRPPRGHVNVVVTCSDTASHVDVNPPRRDVGPQDTVRWHLAGSDSLQITPPDSPPPWPFENSRPTGSASTPASSGRITHAPVDTTVFKYTVTTRCNGRTLILDPELIIVPH